MLLWCDGFDHYGVDENNMLDGPYAQVHSASWDLSTAHPRTGTHHMRWTSNGNDAVVMRRVFGSALTTVGVGMAMYLPNLPITNGRWTICSLRDAANATQVTFYIQTTGAIAVYLGKSTGTLLATSTVLVTAAAWNHFEIKTTIANAGSPGGAVEVRLNNVTVIDISGVDTQSTALAETSQMIWGKQSGDSGEPGVTLIDIDDVFAWDTAGSYNNDFIGDHQVLTLWPDGDTAATDWTRNTGSTDFSAIDEAAPDDDTTYVEATASSQISEYGLDDLPSTVSAIAAVQLNGRMKKTDAGGAMVQQGLLSSDVGSPAAPAEFSGSDRNITTTYTYWPDISEQDPATGAAWTRTAFNAALYKIERTA